MISYKIKISSEALSDIRNAALWYDKQQPGLGIRFQKTAKQRINLLKRRPETYAIRYLDVHCMLVKKFPFLIHFTIDEKTSIVEVFAVFHTSRSPRIWEVRKDQEQ